MSLCDFKLGTLGSFVYSGTLQNEHERQEMKPENSLKYISERNVHKLLDFYNICNMQETG